MPFSTMIGDSRAPSEGFFGTIGAAWSTGLSKVGAEILPNWVQSQASRQSGDQLATNLFDQNAAGTRMAGQQVVQDSEAANGIQKAWFDIKTGSIGNVPVLIVMGLVLVGIVIVVKKF